MDGIDISLVQTNGSQLRRLNKNYFYKYSTRTKNKLRNILKADVKLNLIKKKELDKFVTNEHFLALKNLDIVKNCDIIGFHGQTIYHNPEIKASIQLGDPRILRDKLKKDIIFNFRENDILLGGQGAPLAPIYHRYIIEEFNMEQPCCILNIGGVSNLTYWDGKNLIGFDTGPGNALMDDYISSISDESFDENGVFASKGKPNKYQVIKFLQNNYFKKTPPKSLDRLTFVESYQDLINTRLSVYDTMATLAEFTVESIVTSLELLPRKVKSILVAGGGYRNINLMNLLNDKLKIKIFGENEIGINFDYIESELIAYLSARSIYNLPLTFPSTTGVSKPSSGGKLYKYL